MPEFTTTELPKRTVRERMLLVEPLEGWAEYQSVLQYLRFYGRELAPTARLILLTLIGHEAHTLQVVHETGACHYAVNKGLAELTKRGLVSRECFTLGRFRHSFYRIDQVYLNAKLGKEQEQPPKQVISNFTAK